MNSKKYLKLAIKDLRKIVNRKVNFHVPLDVSEYLLGALENLEDYYEKIKKEKKQ